MKKPYFVSLGSVLLSIFLASLSSCDFCKSAREWGYSGSNGPERWGDIKKEWAVCKNGSNQSPIDIAGYTPSPSDITFHYKASGGVVENNGHTISFQPTSGGYVTIGSKDYRLEGIHFHTPSEHKRSGASHQLEGHLVNRAVDDSLAVVAVLYNDGAANQEIKTMLATSCAKENKKTAIAGTVDPNKLLPSTQSYFRYTGSLTTPPCDEGVTWSVMDTPMTADAADIKKLEELLHHKNARPVQSLNGRQITQGL